MLKDTENGPHVFRAGCENVITSAHINKKLEYFSTSLALKGGFEIYKVKAKKSFQVSVQRLKDKLDRIKASRVQHTVRSKEKVKWEEQYAITNLYKETLQGSSGISVVLEPGKVEGIFRIYNMIGQD